MVMHVQKRAASVLLILITGMVLTGFLAYMVHKWERALIVSSFELTAQSVASEIRRELDASLEVIHSVAGLYASDKNVTREEFRAFVTPSLKQHQELRTLEWIPRVSQEKRPEYEQRARHNGIKHFNLTEVGPDGVLLPARERAEYFPSFYIEPADGNEAALGYDHASDPARYTALIQAAQTGKLVSSAKVKLIQEKFGSSGFMVVKPVYATDDDDKLATEQQRRDQLQGFILGVFVMRDIVQKLLWNTNVGETNFWIYDGNRPLGKNFLFHFPEYSESEEESKSNIIRNAHFAVEHKLPLPNREWSILFTPTEYFFSYHKQWRATYVVLTGVILTLLLTVYLISRIKRENKIEYLNSRLAASNRQLEQQILKRESTEARNITLSSALEQTADAVMITDRNGVIEYVNAAFEQITGFSVADVFGKQPNILKSDKHDKAFYKQMWDTLLRGEVFQNILINKRKNGSIYYEEKTITPLKNNKGFIVSFVSTGKDITDRMMAQQKLHFLAYHDALTKLPNRTLFMDRLNHALSVRREKNAQLAVLFVDLDRFKHINDTLGHTLGDELLTALAKRISELIRKSDTLARLGGDEFAILIEDVKHVSDINVFVDKILDAVSSPFNIKGHELFITLSIGISLFPSDGLDADTLIKNADTAMYRAKDEIRSNYQFYASDMNARAKERLHMQTCLHHAVDKEQFITYYQPQYNIHTGRLVGVEALLRWNHPDRGVVYPSQFISLLEETGLIVKVGRWVLLQACRQAAQWRREHEMDFRMSVNLSPKQLSESDLAHYIEDVLKQTRLPAPNLELEITENVLMHNATVVTKNIEALKSLGVRLAIDDFGTGYASLNYLKKIPISTLKIDRSFINDLPQLVGDSAIVSAIINLANRLSLDVVAEGVETAEQQKFLYDNECFIMQGNLYSKPVAPAQSSAIFHRSCQYPREIVVHAGG